MLRHTITEKDNVLIWTKDKIKTKEKKIFILSGGKIAKKKKEAKSGIECTTKNKWEYKEIAKQLERKNQKYAGIEIDIGMKMYQKWEKNEAKKL